MQSTLLLDLGEFILKIIRKWKALLTAALFFGLSFPETILGFPIRNYIPQEIWGFLAIVSVIVAAFQVYREQRVLITDKLPKLRVVPTSCTITPTNMGLFPQGDLVITIRLDIFNSEIALVVFSIRVSSIDYDGPLFEASCKKLRLQSPTQPAPSIPEKLRIDKGDMWTNSALQIVVPAKYDSLESFTQAMFSPNATGFAVTLAVDAETLDGEKVPLAPIPVKGDFSSILENTVEQWKNLLQHPQNLTEGRGSLTKALLQIVKDYYDLLNKP